MNNRERRIFIKKASVLFAGGVVYSALPIVSACKKESIYDSYFVEKPKCIGCGDCLEACYHDAIDLPVLSSYFIVFHDCSDCGKCVPYCDQGAIKISQIDYNFIGENCVGCGNCIDVCQDEGNCISYEREEYKIKGKCNTNKCQEECFDSCPEGAITFVGNKAKIDMDICTRCGDCVSACPIDAINPAKVYKNDANCNNCGLCYDVCEFNAIERVVPSDYHHAFIDTDLCTRCGDCFTNNACSDHSAIKRFVYNAEIDQQKCSKCGKCEFVCRFEAISSR